MINPASGGNISLGTSTIVAKNKPVAVQPVFHPFLIGAEIGHRRFDLDDQNLAVAAERDQIGAAARRQRQLADHAIADRMQEPRGAARDGERGRRLPSIDRRRCRQQVDAHRQYSGKRQARRKPAFRSYACHTTPTAQPTRRNAYFAVSARSGKAPASAARDAAMTPRSVISPVTRRAGVTSKP